MFRLEVTFRFEAAHKLPHHDGKCARLHGHSWVGRVVVERGRLHSSGPKEGMVDDYADIKAPVQRLVEAALDHHYLNETTGLFAPTSELLAHWIYAKLYLCIPDLREVHIEETCTTRCVYRPHHPYGV